MKSYNITLSRDEFITMRVLAGAVCGDDKLSPRKHTTAIFNKMCEILGTRSMKQFVEYELLNGRSINFDNYPTKSPQELKIEELEKTIGEAQKQLQELKGM